MNMHFDYPIVDVHSHLGDILYPKGGALIGKTGIRPKKVWDPVVMSERNLHRGYGPLDPLLYKLIGRWLTIAEREKNFAATLENMADSLEDTGIGATVCLPIPPHVTFEDLRKAQEKDARVIPFTGVDFGRDYDLDAAFQADVEAGAKGLKLHPIIQNEALNSARTIEAAKAFAAHDLPILFHCGVSSYYLDDGDQNPEFGKIHYARELVEAVPEAKFIAGHSGLFEFKKVVSLLSACDNVWVETSFQSPGHIRMLIDAFGAGKVLFGSDWPYGNRPPGMATVKEACRGDAELEERLFNKNAVELMKLEL